MVCCVFKLVEVESDLESAQKELSNERRHIAEMECEHRAKENNFFVTLNEAEQTENQLSNERHRLVQSLDEAGTELIEMRLRLSEAEACVSALQSQLSQVDGCRLEAETKLASVVSSLRRFVGLGSGGVAVWRRSRAIGVMSRSKSPGGAMTRSKSLGSLHSRSQSSARNSSKSSRFHVKGQFFYISDCLCLHGLS